MPDIKISLMRGNESSGNIQRCDFLASQAKVNINKPQLLPLGTKARALHKIDMDIYLTVQFVNFKLCSRFIETPF